MYGKTQEHFSLVKNELAHNSSGGEVSRTIGPLFAEQARVNDLRSVFPQAGNFTGYAAPAGAWNTKYHTENIGTNYQEFEM
jgi:hypothetical protein